MTEKAAESIRLFSNISGIPFSPVTDPATIERCTALKCLSVEHFENGCRVRIHLCQTGLCHISACIYGQNTLQALFLSAPILCDGSAGSNRQALTSRPQIKTCPHSRIADTCLSLTPTKLSKATGLLAHTLFAESQTHEINFLMAQLAKAVNDKNPSQARSLIDSALPKILMKNGDDFEKNRQDCFCFIVSLYELSDGFGGATWTVRQTFELADATTIGNLKSCLNEACHHFMSAVFPALGLKHSLLIQKACAIIHLNYSQKLTQNEVARKVFVSPSYFSKIFKDSLGISFNQYVNQVRIAKAKELLASNLIEIDAIPSIVGFESRSYFGKVFRTLTGTTPKRYRDSVLGK